MTFQIPVVILVRGDGVLDHSHEDEIERREQDLGDLKADALIR